MFILQDISNHETNGSDKFFQFDIRQRSRLKPVFYFNRIVAKRGVFYCVHIVDNEIRYDTIQKENRLYIQHRVVSQLQRKHMAHAIQFVEETFLITLLILFQISSGKWTVASNRSN